MAKQTSDAQRKTLLRVLYDLRRYQKWLLFTVLLAFITVMLTLLVPIWIGRAIDCIEGAGNVDFSAVTRILLTIGGSVAVTALAQWIMGIAHNKITYEVVEDIRNRAIDRITHIPLSYLDSRPTGDTVSRMISDADQFADGLLLGFTQLFTGVLTIIGTLLFMLKIHPGITVVVILLTPLSMFAAAFIAKRTYSLFRRQAEIRAEQTAMINETVANQKVVQAFCREHGWPFRTYSAGELKEVPGEFTASELVKKVTGVDNVCERSALAEAGGQLLLRKFAKDGVTIAAAARTFAPDWRDKDD